MRAPAEKRLPRARRRCGRTGLLIAFLLLGLPDARALTLAPGDILVRIRDPHSGVGRMARIDPVTGERAIVTSSGYLLGSGLVAIDPDGWPLATGIERVAPRDSRVAIVRVNPASGEQELVYSYPSYSSYYIPVDLVADGAGDIFTVTDEDALSRIDPGTGARTVVSYRGLFRELHGVTIGLDGQLYVTDAGAPYVPPAARVIRVDPVTGEQTIVSSAGDFRGPKGIACEPDGNLLVADSSAFWDGDTGGALFRVDGETGAQSVVIAGEPLDYPSWIGLDHEGTLYLVDPHARNRDGATFRIDPEQKTATLIAGGGDMMGLAIVPPVLAPRPIVPRAGDLCLVPEFAPPDSQASGLPSAVYLAAADLDDDGALDLVLASFFSDRISVLLGRGDGTFAPPATYPTGLWPSAVAIGDLDGDGAPDLAVTHLKAGTVGVLTGRGDGTFVARSAYPTGTLPIAVDIGDLDGDGNPDIAVANGTTRDLTLLFGTGGGAFARRSGNIRIANNGSTHAVTLGDIDNDGSLDIVAGAGPEEGVAVLIGHGDGLFDSPVYLPLPPYEGAPYNRDPFSIVVSDVDGDGNPDIVTANHDFEGEQGVAVLLGHGDGAFDPPDYYPTAQDSAFLTTADLNGDGRLDLAVANQVGGNPDGGIGSVSVLMGYREGKFAPALNFGMGEAPNGVAVADLDGDGGAELISVNVHTNDVSVRRALPGLSVLPRRVNFAEQPVGAPSDPKPVRVTSCGPAPVSVAGAAVSGADAAAFSISSDGCGGSTLPAGEGCDVAVVFTPDQNGMSAAGLQVDHEGPGSPTGIALAGLAPSADLEITLSWDHSRRVEKKGQWPYVIAVRNFGPSMAEGVSVTEIPGGKSKLKSLVPDRGSCGKKSVVKKPEAAYRCELGTLAAGQRARIELLVKVKGSKKGEPVIHRASVESDSFDPVEANDTSSLTVTPSK